MKILFICDYYDDTQLYQEPLLSKYYKNLGHEVYVITSHHTNVFHYVSDSKVSISTTEVTLGKYSEVIYRLPYVVNILNKVKKFINIYDILCQITPDLVYIHDISFNLHEVVRYKKSKKDIRIIMDYHADFSNSGKNWISLNILHKIIRKKYLKFYLVNIDKIFPIVPNGITFLNEIYGIKKERMELLPLGVDTLAINMLRGDKLSYSECIKRKFNIDKDSFIVCTGGKLDELKKTDLLIKSLNFLPKNVHLLIFGKPTSIKYKTYLELLSRNLNVHFLGWLNADDTIKTFLISDLAVFPSGQSVLWQQAIGVGLPLVVGNSGGQSAEYMNKYNNIIVVEKENLNVADFSAVITDLILDKNKLKMMAIGAELTTKNYLDYNIITKKTLLR